MFVKSCQVFNKHHHFKVFFLNIDGLRQTIIGQKWEFPEDDMPGMPGMIKISTENQARFQHIESRVKNILRFFDTENIKELGMNIDNRMMTVNGIKYCADNDFSQFFKIFILIFCVF
jgi:hypothetical protein